MLDLIRKKDLSRNVLVALGHSPEDPLNSIVKEERSLVWKLVEVEKIVGLKSNEEAWPFCFRDLAISEQVTRRGSSLFHVGSFGMVIRGPHEARTCQWVRELDQVRRPMAIHVMDMCPLGDHMVVMTSPPDSRISSLPIQNSEEPKVTTCHAPFGLKMGQSRSYLEDKVQRTSDFSDNLHRTWQPRLWGR